MSLSQTEARALERVRRVTFIRDSCLVLIWVGMFLRLEIELHFGWWLSYPQNSFHRVAGLSSVHETSRGAVLTWC